MSFARDEPQPKHGYLTEDNEVVPGQRFALVSIVGPSGTNQRNEKFGIKIRGCFDNDHDMKKHVERLRVEDKVTDIFVMPLYKWVLIPPDANKIPNQEYQEEVLNDIIKGYMESQLKAKEIFNERVQAVKKDGLDAHLLEHEILPEPPGGSGSGAAAQPSPSEPSTTESTPVAADDKGKAVVQEP